MIKMTNKLRLVVQIIFFGIILFITIRHTLGEDGISLHGICPFGGVVTFYNYITGGSFIKQIRFSSILIMYIVLILAVLMGPVFCGWVCPLGSFQEWIRKIGKKIFKSKYNNFIPAETDRYLRYARIIVLIWVLYVTINSGQLLFKNVDPYFALFNFWTGEVAVTAILMLIVVMVGSLFIERPWCKYLCPYGAFLGFTNKFRIIKIKRNENSCTNCKKCDEACPMNIEISTKTKVTSLQCISCMNCTSENECPVPDTVEFKAGVK